MKRTRGMNGCDSRQSVLRCTGQMQRTNINDLPNSLLQEILGKVDNPEWRGRCRLVCKLWRSHIPGPDPPFALIFNMAPKFDKFLVILRFVSESSIFDTHRGFDLGYLPTFTGPGRQSDFVRVHASCKDLLLCSRLIIRHRQFYIVNPWTMDWTALPSTHTWDLRPLPIGLVAKTSSVDPLRYRFKVVRVTCISSYFFEAALFDPEVYRWSKVRVSYPYELSWKPALCQGLAYNDALHWMFENGPIVAYNPFASPDHTGRSWCRFIMRSDMMRHNGNVNMSIKECITVSEGYIRVIQLTIFPNGNESHFLTVWKLKDYEDGEWVLDHRIYFEDLVSEGVRRVEHDMEPLACHPSNATVVYLYIWRSIVSCNLLTKTINLVASREVLPFFDKHDMAIPITALVQPTPLPRCPSNGLNRH